MATRAVSGWLRWTSTAPAPDKDWTPRISAAPYMPFTVTAPVVELLVMDWNPFMERTGPVKVVFAIFGPYMQVEAYLSACRLARELVRYAGKSGMP